MLKQLLDRYVKIYRLSQVSGNRSAYLTLTVSMEATVQPTSDEKAAMFEGSAGELFSIYVDTGKDLKPGDHLEDCDGNIYQIVSGGIKNRNDGLIADYMEIICKKIN